MWNEEEQNVIILQCNTYYFCKNKDYWLGEMAQWVKALTVQARGAEIKFQNSD